MELTRSLDQPPHDRVDPSSLSGDRAGAGGRSVPSASSTEGPEQRGPSSAHTSCPISAAPIPVVTCPALWELSLNNTLMEKIMKNQIIAAGRELKPFFIPRVPGPRLRAPPWERCARPSPLYGRHRRHRLQLQFSTNRFWNRSCHKREALCLPPFPGAAISTAHGELAGAVGRADPSSASCPRTGQGTQTGAPQQSLHPATLLHPAGSYLPCSAQRQRLFLWEASLDAPVWAGGGGSFIFSGLPSLYYKVGVPTGPPSLNCVVGFNDTSMLTR